MAFATTYGTIDLGALRQEAFELLQKKFPGWEASRGDQLRWLLEDGAAIDAEVFAQMSTLEQAAFKRYGEVIARVPVIQGASATVRSVWSLSDSLGHRIPAGTLVGIPRPGGQPAGFRTLGEVDVPAGSSKAEVLLGAIELGAANNGLSGRPNLETNLSFVQVPDGIELLDVTEHGADEEDEGHYLNRLVERLRLRSEALIVPYDFQVDALSYAGVGRALCIRGYDPVDDTIGNPGMQCLFPVDDDGLTVGAAKEAELQAGQQAMLLNGVIHHVAPPTYTEVDVVAAVEAEAGFDPGVLVATAEGRLGDLLEPSNFGRPANGESSGWVSRDRVRRNDLISVLGRVGGLGHVDDVQLARRGDPLGTADVELDGIACLTLPGTIKVTAT